MHFIIKPLSILILIFSFDVLSKTLEVKVEYNSKLDLECSKSKNYEIKEIWKQELKTKQKQLELEWSKYGEKLISTTEKIVGNKFNQALATANLTLCNTASRSFPLTINMRYSLSSFTNYPVPIYIKTATLYHEILHLYILDNLEINSHLLTLYAQEPQRVKDHLHLLALLKSVYLSVGMADTLSDIIEVDSLLPNGFYKRAWEIINSNPNYYLEFVGELQQSKI